MLEIIQSFCPATIHKGQPTHVTADNFDGCQQTLTRLVTSHHTNSTMYVPKLITHSTEETNAELSTENMDLEFSRGIEFPSSHDISNEHGSKVHLLRERDDTKSYRIGKRLEPPTLTEKNVDLEKDWLDGRLDFDLGYCMAANHSNNDDIEMPPLGPWTLLSSVVTDKPTTKYDLSDFSVILYPPNESVFKDYLNLLIDFKSDLKIDYTENF